MSIAKSFLQSREWIDFQKSLGRPVFEYSADGIKASIIRLPLWFGKSYLYIPHGPDMDFNSMIGGEGNPVWRFLHYLKALGKQEQSIFVKVEPLTDHVAQTLAERKFQRVKREIQPTKTVILDLEQGEDDQKDKMHHKTRYNIGVAEKHGLAIKESEDVDAFWKLLKKTAKRDRFFSHSKEYYEKLLDFFREGKEIKIKLFLAWHEERPIAGALVLFHEDTGFYLHGASDYDQRKYMAPFLLHWKIMQELRRLDFKKYDWWGINVRQWPGVTRFKLGWGGRVVEYPGSFDWRFSWWWYQNYKVARKIF